MRETLSCLNAFFFISVQKQLRVAYLELRNYKLQNAFSLMYINAEKLLMQPLG